MVSSPNKRRVHHDDIHDQDGKFIIGDKIGSGVWLHVTVDEMMLMIMGMMETERNGMIEVLMGERLWYGWTNWDRHIKWQLN